MYRFRLVSVMALILSLVLSACGGGQQKSSSTQESATPQTQATPAAPSTSSAPATPTAQEPLTLKLGLGNLGSTIYLPITYALNNKLFEQEGLKVETVQLKGGAQVTQALVDGRADVAFGAMEHVLKYKQQGIDLMLVATLAEQPGAVLIVNSKYKDTIKSVQDLRGQKIGVTSLGSGSDTIRLLMMEKAGLGPKDVETIGVGFDVPKAFAEDKIVAAIAYAPYSEELITSGKGFALSEPYADLRNPQGVQALFGHEAMPMVTMMIHSQMVSKNPELVQRVVRALVKAEREIISQSPEETAKIVPTPKGISDAAYLEAIKHAKVWLSDDGKVKPETVEAVTGALKHIKALPESATLDPIAVIDNQFASRA